MVWAHLVGIRAGFPRSAKPQFVAVSDETLSYLSDRHRPRSARSTRCSQINVVSSCFIPHKSAKTPEALWPCNLEPLRRMFLKRTSMAFPTDLRSRKTHVPNIYVTLHMQSTNIYNKHISLWMLIFTVIVFKNSATAPNSNSTHQWISSCCLWVPSTLGNWTITAIYQDYKPLTDEIQA